MKIHRVKLLVSAPIAFLSALAFFGATASEVACSSKTCSSSEEQACTDKYTSCINAAAANADKAACDKCNSDYCSCYDSCGNSCDKSKLQACQ